MFRKKDYKTAKVDEKDINNIISIYQRFKELHNESNNLS